MAIRTGEPFGEIGEPSELPVLEYAVGNSQPAHKGVLRGSDIKQAVIAPAEIIRRRGRRIGQRLVSETRIGIERMLFAFKLLLIGKLLACCEQLVLGLQMCRLRPDRFGVSLGDGRASAESA